MENEYKRAQASFIILEPDRIEFLLKRYATPWEDAVAYKKRVIASFVSEIYLYDDRLLIYYNINENQTAIKESDLALVEEACLKRFDQKANASSKRNVHLVLRVHPEFCVKSKSQ